MLSEDEQVEKVVLVTGSARRIGAAIARLFHQHGYAVVLHYQHSKDDAEQLLTELNTIRQASAIAVAADLAKIASLTSLIDSAFGWKNRLDVLVNNASTFYRSDIGSVDEEHWLGLIDVNLRAPFFLSQASLPHLKKVGGAIINITDIHGEKPLSGYDVYCMTKAGLLMQTKSLAKSFAPDVRVNAIAPGAIAWPEGDNALDEQQKQKICGKTPMRRHGDPQDIAKAVYFLASHDFITGDVINVDGGRHLT